MEEKKKIMEEISNMTKNLKEDDLQKLKGVIIGIRLARSEKSDIEVAG